MAGKSSKNNKATENNGVEPYTHGAEMWHEYAEKYGIITARIITGNYLNLQSRNPDRTERLFCDQLREAIALAPNTVNTPIYLWKIATAELSNETALYNTSMKANELCATHIDEAIHASVFGNGDLDCHFNMALAAVIDQHGMDRVRLVLKAAVWHDHPFQRYPDEIYAWAKDINNHDHFGNFGIRTRPGVLVGLVTEFRKKEAAINMSNIPTRETVERLRKLYPEGTRIELVSMDDPYNNKLKPGDKGTVDFIDDTGTIFANWDSGSSLGLVYGVDTCKKLEPELDRSQADRSQGNVGLPDTPNNTDLYDPTVTRSEMHEYGYKWDGMIPLGQERALELFDDGEVGIFRLYKDDSEGLIVTREEILIHDGMFGTEDPEWEEPAHTVDEPGNQQPEGTQTYTLAELIEKMEPQHREHQAVILNCIDGLGTYAMTIAKDEPNSHKIGEIKDLIGYIVPYWGLDISKDAKAADEYQSEFQDKVDGVVYRGDRADVPLDSCPGLADGLYLHGRDLIISQGSDSMGEILTVSEMLTDIAGYSHHETGLLKERADYLKNEVRAMLDSYELPGQAVEDIRVKGYEIKQAVMFDNDRGFAFAHNPEAASPFVTWQFTNEDGDLNCYWGHYFGTEEKALIDYINRVSPYGPEHNVGEKALPEPAYPEPGQPEAKKLIQFIDSDYKELFRIPDGESIRVIYPPGDGREPAERQCKYLGETHLQFGSSTYHICQFAETMERIGAKYEPVTQVATTLSTSVDGEEKFYSYNREEGNTCVGSLHGDFGNSGDLYHSNFNERENGLFNGEIQSELQAVVYTLRQDVLKDRDSMAAYCKSHPEAKLFGGKSSNGTDYEGYGVKVETETRQYFVQCFLQGKESRFALYAYADKPTPSLEQGDKEKEPAAKENKGYTSVLGAIEKNKNEPKPPRRDKTQAQDKNKQNEL